MRLETYMVFKFFRICNPFVLNNCIRKRIILEQSEYESVRLYIIGFHMTMSDFADNINDDLIIVALKQL